MLALTLKMMRGSHQYVTYLYFVPFVWIVAITSVVVQVSIGGHDRSMTKSIKRQ